MARSAKDTKESPSKNVAQKSNLNKAIIEQCWGLFAALLSYKLTGEIIWVATQYTSQRCYSCGYTHEDNRAGRKFLCKKCSHSDHADYNLDSNIEAANLKKLGSKATPTHRHLQPCGKLHDKLHLPHTEAALAVPTPQQTRL